MMSIEYDNQLKIILDKRKEVKSEIDQLSLTAMIATDLHEDS